MVPKPVGKTKSPSSPPERKPEARLTPQPEESAPRPTPSKPASPGPSGPPSRLDEPSYVCKRARGNSCQPKDPETLERDGAAAQAALIKAQNPGGNKEPQDLDRKYLENLENYKLEIDRDHPFPPYDEDSGAWLEKLGVPNFDEGWTNTIVRNKGAPTTGPAGQDNMIMYILQRSGGEGEPPILQIGLSNNAKLDESTGPERLRWSHMTMDIWLDTCRASGKRPEDLDYIIRDNIRSTKEKNNKFRDSGLETQPGIEAAIAKVGGKRTEINTFGNDPKLASAEERAAYNIVAGAAHGHRVRKMLTDHPKTMKNVRIESFSVLTPETRGDSDAYDILIKLHKV